jgi:hypothetical protein
MISGKVALVGAARDVGRYTEAIIRNLLTIRISCPDSDFFILESDSSDKTVEKLKAWAGGFQGLTILCLGNLRTRYPSRTQRLAHVRNLGYSLVRNKPYDYVIWMDLDDATAAALSSNLLDVVLTGPPGWAQLTATKSVEYYDIWALRHPEFCPFDCIAEIKKAGWGNEWAHQKFSREPSRRVLEALKKERFVAVDSAFGGLAILKNKIDLGPAPFVGLNPDGTEVCEWVSYCRRIREEGGLIYVDRNLTLG